MQTPPKRESDFSAPMDRYAAGDDSAFAAVYDEVAPKLYAYLLRQARSESIAEDVLQQTLLRIHLARGSFIQGAALLPWAYAIARRLLIDRSRRHKREVLTKDGEDLGAEEPSRDVSADQIVIAAELSGRMERELAKLPPAQREAFDLVKREGLSMAEAASVLGISVTAVKLRAHRAYLALRSAFGDLADEADSSSISDRLAVKP